MKNIFTLMNQCPAGISETSIFRFVPFAAKTAITKKDTKGIMKDIAIVVTSANQPINGGQNAPPATAITRKDDPFSVNGPRSDTPNAKMVGNIIDMKK